MSNVNKYTPPSSPYDKTVSFGAHRQSDVPASALRAGASSMPAAWQTRGISTDGATLQYGAPVRSFADVVFDPLRWALSSKSRIAASAITTAVLVVLLAL